MSKPLFLNTFSKRTLRVVTLVAMGLAATACATSRLHPSAPVGAESFVVEGRLAVRNSSEGFSSNFVWSHVDAAHFSIELWGPMGQGRSRLDGDGERVVLHASDGSVHEERDATAAVRDWLGIDVPVSALPFWMKGQSAPDLAVATRDVDADGDLTHLTQAAWMLEFAGYAERPDGRRLPARIVATQGDVKVTLLPKSWTFPEPTAAKPLN